MHVRPVLWRAALLAALSIAAIVAAPSAFAQSKVPFTDQSSVGQLTLCDTQGKVLTHGDTRIKPFAWRAVGSASAPTGYNGAGRNAALFAYQPLRDVDPTSWYGQYLTSGSQYTSATKPMAAATAADPSLADYLKNYPPKWDGLVQLRMVLGAPHMPSYVETYNSAVIKVAGTSWTLVSGGHTGCATGTAASAELILPKVRSLGTPAPNATTDAPNAPGLGSGKSRGSKSASSRLGSPTPTGSSTAGAADGSGSTQAPAAQASTASSSGSSSPGWWIGGVVAALLAAGAVIWRRRAA